MYFRNANTPKGSREMFNFSTSPKRIKRKSAHQIFGLSPRLHPRQSVHSAMYTPSRIEGNFTGDALETEAFSSHGDKKYYQDSPFKLSNLLEVEEEDDSNEFVFEDGRKTKFEHTKLQIMEIGTALAAFIGASLTVIVVFFYRYEHF